MNRASPVDLRKSMERAKALVAAGIAFVPMPVLDNSDNNRLVAAMQDRLDTISSLCEVD